MDALLLEAVGQALALGPDRSYACFSCSGQWLPWVLPRLAEQGRLQAWVEDPSAAPGGHGTCAADPRLEAHCRHFSEFPQAPSEPISGVLIHLGAPPLQSSAGEARQEQVQDWLQNATAEELASALDAFGSLHDSFLAERLAEAILQRRRSCGRLAGLLEIEEVLEDLRPDYAQSHPNLSSAQVLRALGAAARQEVQQLSQLLESAFRLLEPNGRCVLVTFSPWELSALRRFLRSHEEPACEATKSIAPDRLARLYPLLASGEGYVARRISKSFQPASDDFTPDEQVRTGMLHVVEKAAWEVPRSSSPGISLEPASGCDSTAAGALVVQPPAPEFGGHTERHKDESRCNDRAAEPPCNTELQDSAQLGPDQAAEAERLREEIAARKRELKEAGQGAAQQKKDPQLAASIRRLNELHCTGQKYIEKVHQRCRDRPHISVLLEEAIEHTMHAGPDEVYVDCTFGRGGHSRLMLSRLSEKGRLKAFDVDPDAVEVGRALEREDGRLEMLHRPFGELKEALEDGVAGVLLDLGVSSPQLDEGSRGFSARSRKDGPLDLRMNPRVGVPASEWLQTVTAGQLAWVISSTCYVLEAPLPERIAEAILERQRRRGPYGSTAELAAVLEDFSTELGDERPKTSLAHIVFCALRVFLNREMEQLELALDGAFERLKPSGRCVVICFTRWETAAVRRFLRRHEDPVSPALATACSQQRLEQLYPLLASSGRRWGARQVRRPVKPTAEEIARNQRAKSLMYVLEKVERCH